MQMKDLKPGDRFKITSPHQQRGEFIMLQLHSNLNAVGVDGPVVNYGRRIWANPRTGDTWGSQADDAREVELLPARSSADAEQRASTPHVGGSNPSARAIAFDFETFNAPYGAGKHENLVAGIHRKLSSLDYAKAEARIDAWLASRKATKAAVSSMSGHGSLTHDERVFHVPVDHPRVYKATVFFRKPKAGDRWQFSIAYCHESDAFSKKTGRRLARNRFLQHPELRYPVGLRAPSYELASDLAQSWAPRV